MIECRVVGLHSGDSYSVTECRVISLHSGDSVMGAEL